MIADIQATQPCKSTLLLLYFQFSVPFFAKLCIFVVDILPLSNPINMSFLAAREGYDCVLYKEQGLVKPNCTV